MSLERRRTLMKSSIESQSGYCPFVWMFCGRKTNNRTNHLHERTLRIVYNESQSSFENLLRKDRLVSINHRNIRSFAIDIYKIKNNMSTPTMSEVFEKRNFFFIHFINFSHNRKFTPFTTKYKNKIIMIIKTCAETYYWW